MKNARNMWLALLAVLVIVAPNAEGQIFGIPRTLQSITVAVSALISGTLTVNGLSDFADGTGDATLRVNSSGGIQVTGDCGNGTYNATAGVGIEVCELSGNAQLQAYNRNTSNYANMRINASSLDFTPSGGTAIDMTPAYGSVVMSFTDACTTTPTQTVYYAVVGNVITLSTGSGDGFSCTSDSVSTLTTGNVLPAAARPSITRRMPVLGVMDNGTSDAQNGCLQVNTDGSLTMYRGSLVTDGSCTVAWTNAGTKRVQPWTVSYVK